MVQTVDPRADAFWKQGPQEAAVSNRPALDDYYLGVAIAIAARAECKGQHVGAVIVGDGNRILSTGYNGAPEGFGNCSDGGVCTRCDHRDAFGSGNAYDKCICVHAEMNAIATASRFGMTLDRATAYVTHQPCFTCAKELIQAGISRVHYAIPMAAPAARLHKCDDCKTADDLKREAQVANDLVRVGSQLATKLDARQTRSAAAVDGLHSAIKQFHIEEDA